MSLKLNKQIQNSELFTSVKSTLKKSFYYSAVAATALGTSISFLPTTTAQAGDVAVANTKNVTAGDKTGDTGGDLAADDQLVFAQHSTINTEAAAMTIAEIESGTTASIITLAGTGTLVNTGNLTLTQALTIKLIDTSDFTVAGATAGSATGIIDIADSGILRLTGASKTFANTITADANTDGVINMSGTITQSGAIGASGTAIGVLNITGASTLSAASFILDVNVGAATTLTGITGTTVDLTGTGTDTTILTSAGINTAITTMNATGQTVTLSGTADHAGAIKGASDGFGIVKVTGAMDMVGNIGTSTTVKVGLLNVDEDFDLEKNAFVDATQLSAAKTMSLRGSVANLVVTGTIDGDATDADGQGMIIVNNGTATATAPTFTGNIGATHQLDSITLTSDASFNGSVDSDEITIAASQIGTFKGDLTLGAADMTVTGRANLDGTTTQTIVGGAAGEEIDGTGTIDVNNTSTGGVVFGTHATMDANTLDFLVSAAGRATMAVGLHTVEEVNLADGAILVIGDAVTTKVFTTTTGQNADSIHASSIIKFNSNFDNGETIELFNTVNDSDKAALAIDVNSALLDNALTDYVATVTSDDITVTATNKGASATATELSITKNDAIALMEIKEAFVANSASDLDFINELLMSEQGRTSADIDDLAKQAAPQQDTIVGSSAALKANTGAVQGVISNRMASLRSGDAYVAGMSAGNGVSANSMFIQAFGSIVEQDDKIVGSGHQAGYDADTSGVAIGIDSITDGGLVLGLSVSMSNTDLEGKGTGKAKNDIDSYTASIYMDKTSDVGYVEGSVTFGISENANQRLVNSAGLDRTYKCYYYTQQVSVKICGGLTYEAQNGAFITPFASVTGTLVETDAYTETSSTAGDALRLRVDQDDINSIKGSVGIKAHMDTGNGIPMISLAVNNEFGDKDMITTNKFQGGGSAFKSTTALEELSATLGLGYTFTNGNTDINVGYEAEANDDDYLGHYGTVKFTSRF
jgi:uncharacterized protein with beta-barrel porin domain